MGVLVSGVLGLIYDRQKALAVMMTLLAGAWGAVLAFICLLIAIDVSKSF
ncbi:MAG: hypothetical protein IH624_10500 [Phycisphaerae bacterium]|nr:hypothetical protein [Phycisphaerae bacterium]